MDASPLLSQGTGVGTQHLRGVLTCTGSCIPEVTLPAGPSHNLQVTTSLALLSSLKATHKCSEVQDEQAALISHREDEHVKGAKVSFTPGCWIGLGHDLT